MTENTKGRAIIFHSPGTDLEHCEYDVPSPSKGEVLVKIVCCTLCGSDIHSFKGNRGTPVPTVLGHEILGRIAELPVGMEMNDLNGAALSVGDRVTWSVAASCGDCYYCNEGLPQKCGSLFKYGHESIETTYPFNGGLADYCLLAPGTAILKVPDNLPDEIVCPVNCATATVAAAFRLAGDCKNRTVLVQGAGMLGLTATAMATSKGACDVIVADVSPDRLNKALEFGATKVVSVANGPDELHSVILACTNNRGADVAIEVCGVNDSAMNCINMIRIGGRCILVGSTFPSDPLPVNIESIVRGIKTIKGIHNYTPQDLAAALDFLIENGETFPFASLVGKEFSLDETPEAFDYAINNDVFRVAVKP